MASGNTYSDDMWSKSEVIDPPQSEDMMEVNEHVNDPVHTTLKPNVTISSSVQELLEYPCSNDHTWCSRCKSRVHNRCLTCMHELGNIRCLVLERIVTSLELPCKYQSFGCLGTYPNYNKLKHESQCVYRPYYCPYVGPECTVISNIPYLVTHLKDDRKIDTHNGSTFNHCYVKSNPHEVFNYIAFVRFMGDDNEAKSCDYSLEVKGLAEDDLARVPRGIKEYHRKVRLQLS
ncbi:hypothetical protein AAG906_001748 [Vitis piasezkii]